MAEQIGTRIKGSFSNTRSDSSGYNRSYTRDLGMVKLVTDNFTYSSAGRTITGVAGDFSNFVFQDPIFVAGTNLNGGYFVVMSVAGDGSSITVDPPPKDEGPISSTVRTV